MRLSTIRTSTGTTAVRVTPDGLVDLGVEDLSALLALPHWREHAGRSGDVIAPDLDSADLAVLLPRPGKVVCTGLNYLDHADEMGMALPEHPTLFAKFAEALIGGRDDIVMPPETERLDWEAELAIVVGATVRRADESEAESAIAGFTVLNDVSVRDWQTRTGQWLQGKTWEATTPVGPVLVTPDELPGGVRPDLAISASIDGETVQSSRTANVVFDPVALVRYVSTIVTLRPGDVIATGTPAGVGMGMTPARWLAPGQVLRTEIEGIGVLHNTVRRA